MVNGGGGSGPLFRVGEELVLYPQSAPGLAETVGPGVGVADGAARGLGFLPPPARATTANTRPPMATAMAPVIVSNRRRRLRRRSAARRAASLASWRSRVLLRSGMSNRRGYRLPSDSTRSGGWEAQRAVSPARR